MHRVSVFVRLAVPALLVVLLGGCERAREMFSAHAEVAARAADQELRAERLAEILGTAKGVRLSREGAEMVANVWVDYTLLAQAEVLGELPTDSAEVAEVFWPEIVEIKASRWHDTLMARRSTVQPGQVDSLYNKSDQRLFQHILFAARANAADTIRSAKRKQAEATLAQIRKGAGFGRLASRLSEDPGSRADSGYLPLGPRGRFVASFDSAAWLLKPGETSGLVETPYGYHILRRPGLDEVRGRLNDHLLTLIGVRLDSTYMDSLANATGLELTRDAPALMREAAEDPNTALQSPRAVARFKGGELSTKDLVRWVNALPPQYAGQIRQADDSSLRQFARVLSQNTLLLRDAEASGIRLTSEEWADMQRRYKVQLDSLRADMGLDAPELHDESVPAAQRRALAATKVTQYFDRLKDGKGRLRPLPFALASVLRTRLPSRLDDTGISRSLELAKEQAAARGDTTRTPGLPGQPRPGAPGAPGGMQPAPGPAPVPDQPPTAAPAPSAGGAGAAPRN